MFQALEECGVPSASEEKPNSASAAPGDAPAPAPAAAAAPEDAPAS